MLKLRYLIWIILFGFLVSLGAIYAYSQMNTEQQPKSTETRFIQELDEKNIQLIGDKKQFVLSSAETTLVGGRFLFGRNYNEVKKTESSKERLEFIGFSYYDLDTKELKTVNVLEKAHQMDKKNNVIRIGLPSFGGAAYKNTIYIEILKSGEAISETKRIYYDLESEKYYTPTDLNKIPKNDELDRITLSLTNLNKSIGGLGYYYDASYRSIEKSDKDAATSINLFKDHPKLEDELIKENMKLSIRYNLMTEKEVFDTLLYWFAPKGEQTLSGVKIKAEYSIDGQEHEIHSYDEFKQYYNGKRGELSE